MVKEMASNFDNLSKEEKFKAGIKLYLSLVTPPLTLAKTANTIPKTAKPLLPAVPLRINPPRAAKQRPSEPLIFSAKAKLSTQGGLARTEYNAANVNAQAALNTKMRALQKAQNKAIKTKTFSDGRIRYYEAEKPQRISGPTRGRSHVTEWNPSTGQVRAWSECYDQKGNVNRINPKMIDGKTIDSHHYPPTGKELENFKKKLGAPR